MLSDTQKTIISLAVLIGYAAAIMILGIDAIDKAPEIIMGMLVLGVAVIFWTGSATHTTT